MTQILASPTFDAEMTAYYGAGRGPNRMHIMFRCRVFQNESLTVVLLTDLDDRNPGTSITNGIEYAVRTVFERLPELNVAHSVIVEHYDDRERNQRYLSKHKRLDPAMTIGRENGESFDFVTFDPSLSSELPTMTRTEPHWRPTSKREIENLIGGTLP